MPPADWPSYRTGPLIQEAELELHLLLPPPHLARESPPFFAGLVLERHGGSYVLGGERFGGEHA